MEKSSVSRHSQKTQSVCLRRRNLLAEAVHEAFYEHYPLILSPDVIWLTIAQGLAHHVRQDPGKMRKYFVDFKDRKTIVISRPDFIKGSPDNDWPSVFPEFAKAIGDFIGHSAVENMTCNFSTTGSTERIASQITMMDTVQHYFEYDMRCGCGIPQIGLRGTVDDWQKLRAKAETLRRFELDWWLKELLPVLDHFITAAGHKPDKRFWRSICNFSGASGFNGDPITGWLQVFFPYSNASSPRHGAKTKDGKAPRMTRNEDGLKQYRKAYKTRVTAATYKRNGWQDTGCGYGLELKNIPPGLCSAPFRYMDHLSGQSSEMAFFGGISCLVQHPKNLALEPTRYWVGCCGIGETERIKNFVRVRILPSISAI